MLTGHELGVEAAEAKKLPIWMCQCGTPKVKASGVFVCPKCSKPRAAAEQTSDDSAQMSQRR